MKPYGFEMEERKGRATFPGVGSGAGLRGQASGSESRPSPRKSGYEAFVSGPARRGQEWTCRLPLLDLSLSLSLSLIKAYCRPSQTMVTSKLDSPKR